MEKKYKLSITPLLRYWKGGGGVVVFDSQPSVRSVLSASKRGGSAYQALVIVAKDGSLANPDKLMLMSGTFVQIDESGEEDQSAGMVLPSESENEVVRAIVGEPEPMIRVADDDDDVMDDSDDNVVEAEEEVLVDDVDEDDQATGVADEGRPGGSGESGVDADIDVEGINFNF